MLARLQAVCVKRIIEAVINRPSHSKQDGIQSGCLEYPARLGTPWRMTVSFT